ncbi:5231_t:CDS:2 [Entrophospora sp. SA101]|nr:9972_t:CDS:2 [Entrophospora sp. SA101]CAJ0635046.1 5231_t:CDS:2 [Entrophospora sp. SA101]CAJ0840293.1 6599_t:CDS:2 [Entrophospora sp. SA101]CAJ0892101.1 1465_t:CDS:2 [Entrophospora sp. SA101]
MSEKKFLYVKGETKDFDTNHENIRVEIEVLNEDIASDFLVDKNDIQLTNRKSYFITWINNYDLSVLIMLLGLIDDEPKSSHTENGPDDEARSCNEVQIIMKMTYVIDEIMVPVSAERH